MGGLKTIVAAMIVLLTDLRISVEFLENCLDRFGHYEPFPILEHDPPITVSLGSFTRRHHVPLLNPLPGFFPIFDFDDLYPKRLRTLRIGLDPSTICAAKRDQPGRAGSFAPAAPQSESWSAASKRQNISLLLDLVLRLLPSVLPLLSCLRLCTPPSLDLLADRVAGL